jgi:hypothetical protein
VDRRRENRMNKKLFLIILMIIIVDMIAIPVVAQETEKETVTYFQFTIPEGVTYSPGWFGMMDKSPQNVTVVYYNEKDGYGIASTTDSFIPREITVIDRRVSDLVVASAMDETGIYFGEKLENRWLPEIRMENREATVSSEGVATLWYESKSTEMDREMKVVESRKAMVCPVCDVFIQWYAEDVMERREILTCSNGHKFVTASYDTLKLRTAK